MCLEMVFDGVETQASPDVASRYGKLEARRREGSPATDLCTTHLPAGSTSPGRNVLLITMHRVIGGIKVQDQLVRRALEGLDERLNKHPVHQRVVCSAAAFSMQHNVEALAN